MSNSKKKKINKLKSYNPMKVVTDVSGNKKINSMSYKRKKIQISKNWTGTRMGFCVIGRNPHS